MAASEDQAPVAGTGNGRAAIRPPPATGPSGGGTTVPGAPNCPMFPASNVWNTDISQLPVNAAQRGLDAEHGLGQHSTCTPISGRIPAGSPSASPYNIVTSAHPVVPVKFQYASESDKGPYPFGPDTLIEGGQNAGGDRHAIMVNKTTCTLYELWEARYSASGSTAGSGAIWQPDLQPAPARGLDLRGRGRPAHPAGAAELQPGQGGGQVRPPDHPRDQVHRAVHPVGLPVAGQARGGLRHEPDRCRRWAPGSG